MDPLSVTASIIAVIQLSSEVVKYVGAAGGSTRERKRLREEVRACEQMLQSLKDDADDAEEGDAWSETVRALEAPGAPLGRLWVALSIVKLKVEPKQGLKKVVSKLKWPFDEHEVVKIISMIEHEKNLLHLALSNDCRKLIEAVRKSSIKNGKQLEELVQAIQENSDKSDRHFATQHDLLVKLQGLHMGFKDSVDEVCKHQVNQEQQVILDWLTPLDSTTQQNDFLAQRHAGTGQWLLDSTEFQEWLKSHQQTIYCPGIPGSGKTISVAIVVDHLTSHFQRDDSVGIAYFYCNFRRQHEQKYGDVIASLLKQLAYLHGSLPLSVMDLYDRHKESRTRASLDEICGAFRSVAATYSKVFIIVDALDECDKAHRESLLSEVLHVQRECGANVFVTARDIPGIRETLQEFVSLPIRANNDDVKRYIEGQISHPPACVGRNPELQTEIKEKIIKAVDGMFLLARLHLDSLKGKAAPKMIRTALNTLPAGSKAYDRAYQDAMARIEGQLEDEERLAKQVLLWITCAKRPLTTIELEHALAVEMGKPHLDEENLCQVEDMLPVCAGLVVVDKETDVIRLVHYTTQEYFERTQCEWFPSANPYVTKICVTYLMFDVFESGSCYKEKEFEQRLESNPFYDYAAKYWGHHAREASIDIPEVMGFLKTKGKANASFQALLHEGWWDSLLHTVDSLSTALHITAYFGIKYAVKDLLAAGITADTEDTKGRTPLIRAIEGGHDAVIQVLIENGAAVNRISGDGNTPLSLAVREGREAVVRLLLENGAEVELEDDFGWAPLLLAARYGHESVIQLLVENGAAVNRTSRYGKTPLSLAVREGREAMVRLLLENGAEVELEDDFGWTPLWIAAASAPEAVLKLLLEKNAKVDSKDLFGSTPLSMAVENRHEAVVQPP